MKIINSKQNKEIKKLLSLQEKKRIRDKEKKFVIEGVRELKLAIEGKYEIEKIFFVKELISIEDLPKTKAELIEISKDLYAKLAYRKTTEGVIAIAKQKDLSLKNLKLRTQKPLLLVAEQIEKPGNMGAMLRTCEAAGIDAFILINGTTDIYNPNVIRSSLGSVFTVNIGIGNIDDLKKFLKANKIKLYSATLQNQNPYYKEDFRQSTAIAVGSEAKGLSDEFRAISDKQIIIPMSGKVDSLNVSVSAAILIFEAKRQREIN